MNIATEIPFNPNVKDGRGTSGLEVPKTNWANRIDDGPFEAYHVGCGITFTFGGLRIDPETAQAMDTDLRPIPGLYAAGELLGGLFYSSVKSGAVENACLWRDINIRFECHVENRFSTAC